MPSLIVRAGHPRLWITPAQLPEFRRQARGFRRPWRDLLFEKLEPHIGSAPALRACGDKNPEFLALALGEAWRLSGDEKYARAGRWLIQGLWNYALGSTAGYDTWGVAAETVATLYDWMHDYWVREGEAEKIARLTAFCARRALEDFLRIYIVDDWHNYALGLQAGVLAGAIALGRDFPRLENGDLLRTMHALHFTGYRYDGHRLQDVYSIPPTTLCLDTALRAAGGAGFGAHAEATGGYHTVDAWEFVKFTEWWESGLERRRGRGRRRAEPVWPEMQLTGVALLQFLRPDFKNFVWGDSAPYPGDKNTRIANCLYHLNARRADPVFREYLRTMGHCGEEPFPCHALLRGAPGNAAESGRAGRFDRGVLRAWPSSTFLNPIALLRSGWDADATFISFRCGRHCGGHNHFDHNSFTIYRGGPLAVDSGWVAYLDRSRTEYAIRTLAHNSMLVRDPREKAWKGRHRMPMQNDGGQRLATYSYSPPNEVTGDPHAILSEARRAKFRDEFDMGKMLAFEPGEQIDYLAGDATRAYTYPWSGLGDNPARRVEEFVRQVVFIKPDLIVIFDRVEATQPQFEKTWLLHMQGDPVAFARGGQGRRIQPKPGVRSLPAGACVQTECERGRLTVWPLWPPAEAQAVRVIGGAGFECWVEHPPDAEELIRTFQGEGGVQRAGGGVSFTPPPETVETGRWRLEVRATKAERRTYFLTVLHAGLRKQTPVHERYVFTVQDSGERLELAIRARTGGRKNKYAPMAEVRFEKQGRVGCNVVLQGAGCTGGVEGIFDAPAPERVPRAKG